jgi:hypothetical protein
MNSHALKIIGTSEIPSALAVDKEYTLNIQGDCISVKKQTDDEGGFNYTYSVKQKTGEIASDDGNVIKIKDRASHSRKWRMQLVNIALDRNENPDEFYDKIMIKLRHNAYQVLDLLESLKDI